MPSLHDARAARSVQPLTACICACTLLNSAAVSAPGPAQDVFSPPLSAPGALLACSSSRLANRRHRHLARRDVRDALLKLAGLLHQTPWSLFKLWEL